MQPNLHHYASGDALDILGLNLLGAGLLVLQVQTIHGLAELLFMQAQFLENSGVRLPDWLNLEEAVHGLQRHTLCLGHTEEHEDDRQDHHSSEEEVNTVAHRVKHVHSESCDDEVPEPVVCSSIGLSERSCVLVEHLGVEDPRGAVPRRGVEGGPQVEKEDGGSSCGGQVNALSGCGVDLGGAGNLDVCADEVHAERTATSTDHEQVAATHVIDQNHDPHKGENGFDNAKDSGSEETSVGAGDAQALEDGGGVVVDSVDAGSCIFVSFLFSFKLDKSEGLLTVLEDKEKSTEEEAPLNLTVLEG